MPEQHPYEHQPPKRPSHLARRTEPPPERAGPPDLSLFLYVGVVLLGILAFIAIPYIMSYVVNWLTTR